MMTHEMSNATVEEFKENSTSLIQFNAEKRKWFLEIFDDFEKNSSYDKKVPFNFAIDEDLIPSDLLTLPIEFDVLEEYEDNTNTTDPVFVDHENTENTTDQVIVKNVNTTNQVIKRSLIRRLQLFFGSIFSNSVEIFGSKVCKVNRKKK